MAKMKDGCVKPVRGPIAASTAFVTGKGPGNVEDSGERRAALARLRASGPYTRDPHANR
jgi:hypothetical protein